MLRPLEFLSLSLSLERPLSLEKWTLSLSLAMCSGPHPASCYHDEKKSHLYILLFFDFSLFSFRWVRVLSCVCQRRQAQDSAKPANAHFNDSWTLSQSATSEKPFSRKDGGQREIFKHISCKYKPQTFAATGVILKIDFSLIEKVNASVKYVIDDCSGLCNCTYCCKRGISNSHSLNLILSSLSLFLQRVNVWMLVFMCRVVYMS